MGAHGEELRIKLKKKLDGLPEKPGVYQMRDALGRIIYVGKSKCLKNRVKSYFVPEPKWEKVNKMIPYISDFTYIITDTHLEARLLECEMIKEVRPYFNVMMKDDHLYVYLKLREYNTSNPLGVTYVHEADTYGIYRRRSKLEEAIADLRKLYPIQKEKRSYIVRDHLFPVALDREAFAQNRSVLKELLDDPKAMGRLIGVLEKEMRQAASRYRFETAGKYKEHVESLRYIKKGIDGYRDSIQKTYLLNIPVEEGCKFFYIQKGFVVWKETYPKWCPEAEEVFLSKARSRAREGREEMEGRCLEKGRSDYREIVFTELTNLPKEMVKML